MRWPFRRGARTPKPPAPPPPELPVIDESAAAAIADRFFSAYFRSDIPRRAWLLRGPGRPAWAFDRTEPDGRPYSHRGGNIRLLVDARTGAITGFWLERR